MFPFFCLPSYCAELRRLRENSVDTRHGSESVAVEVIGKLQIFSLYTFRSYSIYIFILYVHEWQNVGRHAGCLNKELSTVSNDKIFAWNKTLKITVSFF